MTSNEKRAALRKAISAHKDWPAYRDERGLTVSGLTSVDQCVGICEVLRINHDAVLADAAAADLWGDDDMQCPHGLHIDEDCPDCGKPAPVKAPVNAAPDDLGAALVALKAALGGSVDADAVKAIVDEAIAPLKKIVEEAAPVLLTVDRDGQEVAKIDGLRHETFEILAKAGTARDTSGHVPGIWLAGPSQSGKSTACSMLAKALGLEFASHGAMEFDHQLIGFIDGRGEYHETPFVRLYRNGGVCLCDELDGWSAEATLTLNGPIANGFMFLPTGERIERHRDFIIIGAANTWGSGADAEYVGRNKLDGAFLQRFPVRLFWDYDAKLERKMSGNEDFAARVQNARREARKAGLKVLITPADSKAGAALIASGFTEDEAAKMTFLAGLKPEQAKMLEGA